MLGVSCQAGTKKAGLSHHDERQALPWTVGRDVCIPTEDRGNERGWDRGNEKNP